ncbi:MAG: hypothetical protein R2867_21130 [Caldilineaceae bacterium]
MRFFGGLGLAGVVLSLLTFLYLTALYLFTDTPTAPNLYCSRRARHHQCTLAIGQLFG